MRRRRLRRLLAHGAPMTALVYIFETARLALTAEELAAGRSRYEALGAGANVAPAQAPVAERWLTSRELAELTGVGDTWWEAMAARGEVPHIRAGKALRFRLSEVLDRLRSRPGDSVSPRLTEVHESTGRISATTKKPPSRNTGLSGPDPQEARPR